MSNSVIPEPTSLLELCRNILELARQEDYSNKLLSIGDIAQDRDEGDVLAFRMMADYEQQIKWFEENKK